MKITTATDQIQVTPPEPVDVFERARRLADAYRALADWIVQHPTAARSISTFQGRVAGCFIPESQWTDVVSNIGPFRKTLDDTYARAIVDLSDGFNLVFATTRGAVCELVETDEVEEVEVEVEVEPAVTETRVETRPVMKYVEIQPEPEVEQ